MRAKRNTDKRHAQQGIGGGEYSQVLRVLKREKFNVEKVLATARSNVDKAKLLVDLQHTMNQLTVTTRYHEHLVNFQGAFLTAEEFFTVSDFCEMRDLGTMIRDVRKMCNEQGMGGPDGMEFGMQGRVIRFTPDTICLWTAQIGHALIYLHKNELVHGNVKPTNVLLQTAAGGGGEGFKLMLGDYGYGYWRELCGTKMKTKYSDDILYYPPEVLLGRNYSEKSEVWGLGCVLYALCALDRPFNFPVVDEATLQAKKDKEAALAQKK